MEGMTGYVMPLEPPAVGWDIHCHTAFSDGTETPATLAEQSKALGLKGVAISDHDTTAGWPEAEAAAHRVGLPLLRGTEITATDENVSVHMLGYQYDPRISTSRTCSPILEPHGCNARSAWSNCCLVIIRLPGNPCSPKSRRVAKPPLAGLTSLMLW